MEMVRKKRLFCLAMLVLLLLGGVGTRVAQIQILKGPELARRAVKQRAQTVPLEVPRGDLLDRNGLSLTAPEYLQRVLVFPGLMDDRATQLEQLAGLLGLPASRVAAQIPPDDSAAMVDLGEVTDQVAARVAEARLPGIIVVPGKTRYGKNSLARHLVGYINAIDNRGVLGLEATMDEWLRGTLAEGPDSEAIMAFFDALGRPIRGLTYGYRPVKNSTADRHDLVLTIDRRIQEIVEKAMDDRRNSVRGELKGAVVVVDVRTGDLLALASRPNFDQSQPLEGDATDGWLLNRAVRNYPPGSTFKIVVAAAALEAGVAALNDLYNCRGYIDVGSVRFKGYNYDQGGHGPITFEEALAYSSNPVFIELGLALGGDRIVEMASKLGLGRTTGLNLFDEKAGNLESPRDAVEEAMLALGQGRLLVTPLQMAAIITAVANDGLWRPLRLLKEIRRAGPAGGTSIVVKTFQASRHHRVFSASTANQLKLALTGVTRYGTGTAAFIPRYGSAGKTGTSETGRKDVFGNEITHAWFAGFTPLYNPRYAIVVFVEDGGSGGAVAAPIFRQIAEAILAGG